MEHSLDPLINLIKSTSLRSLKAHTRFDDLKVVETDEDVFDHWLAVMLLASKNIKITLRTFFSTQNVKHLMSKTYELDQLNQQKSTEFLREFNNLTLGSVKVSLENAGIGIGIGLPIITRGFDVFFSNESFGGNKIKKNWAIERNNSLIKCQVVLEIFGAVPDFSKIDNDSSLDDDFGDVEVF